MHASILESCAKRSAPFNEEPGQHGKLWLYGNVRLLQADLACVGRACGQPVHTSQQLEEIEKFAEQIVLDGKILVCGVHNPAHQRAAVVPLRWGSPRIVVFSGGFKQHLGDDLKNEAFRAARLWRYAWDPLTDLAVSRRAPDKRPTWGHYNPTVDSLIVCLAAGARVGLLSPLNADRPFLS